MDKVQVVLEYLKKYHFWLLCLVAVVASLLGWMSAGGRLSEEFKKGKSKVESQFSSLKQIEGDQNPPNDTWKAAIDKLTDQGREEVAAAWESVYGEQQKVLEWPKEILGDETVRWLNSNKDTDIPLDWRVQYRDEVARMEFPKLVAIVDAELMTEEEDSARSIKPDEPPPEYKVVWTEDSQKQVRSELGMPGDEIPNSEVVRLRQEDLWVFRALLDIIRDTNKDTQYTSRVKRINRLSIGAEAAKEFQTGMQAGHVDFLTALDDGSGEQDEIYNDSGDDAAAPDAGRYVDQDGGPLASGQAASQQFKRLPVYLQLEMNQSEITRLLTNCANYPLPVEVKQFRMNPDYEGLSKNGPANVGQSATGDLSPTATGRQDVTVEIHGIIYIYNPPDRAKLGLSDDAVAVGG